MEADELERNTILLFEYGSRAHGTANVDSDRDLMGIAIEPPRFVTGLSKWDFTEVKTAAQGMRSNANDVDTTIYSLRKWAKLAAQGNPNVLTAFFAPEYEVKSLAGYYLLEHKHLFLSRTAGLKFLGFMVSQREALLGRKNKRTNRPELEEKHGYDTKFAYQMIRLGLQGIRLMEDGYMQMPFVAGERGLLAQIRAGNLEKKSVIDLSHTMTDHLQRAMKESDLPDRADYEKIDTLLHEIHENHWKQTQ